MDTPSLIRIKTNLQDGTIVSKLPPLLGPLPKDNGEVSYGYHNILELENCQLTNHTVSTTEGTMSICHYYLHKETGPDYSNKYIDTNSLEVESRPTPTQDPVKGLKWINMTHFQLASMVNEKWFEFFERNILVFDSVTKKYSFTLPPGIGIYLCHPIVWDILGLYSEDLIEKYEVTSSSELRKFSGSLRKSISGYCNYRTDEMFTMTGEKCSNNITPELKHPVLVSNMNQQDILRTTWFFGIIPFASNENSYVAKYTTSFNLDLVPSSLVFMNELMELINTYSAMILEYSYIDEEDEFLEDKFKDKSSNALQIFATKRNQMVIQVDEAFSSHNIVIHISLNPLLANYIGKDSITIKNRINLINAFDQTQMIQANIFKYPYYLVLCSSEYFDVDFSVIDNKNLVIIAIIHSETKFTTTQGLVRLRPTRFNKLVLRVLDKNLAQVTEKVTCDLLFRFKREFIEENTNLYRFYN